MKATEKEVALANEMQADSKTEIPKKEASQSKKYAIPGAGKTLTWIKNGRTFSAVVIRMYPNEKFLVRLNGEEVTIRCKKDPVWKDQGQNKNVPDSYTLS